MPDRRWLPFVLLAYAISWGIYAIARWGIGVDGPMGWLLTGALFMLGPAVAAAIVRRRTPALSWHVLGVTFSGIRWKWVWVAVGIAILLAPSTLLLNTLLGNVCGLSGFGNTAVTLDRLIEVVTLRMQEAGIAADKASGQLDMLRETGIGGGSILLLALVVGAIAGCSVNLPFALGEELGWRGLLLSTTRHWGLGKHTLVTGVVWGLWHAPLILQGHNYPEHPWLGVCWMCGLTTAMAVPLAWVRVRSGCIWAPGVLHGTVNATAGVVILFTKDGSSLFASPAGLSGMLALVLVSVVLLLADRSFPRAFRTVEAAVPTAAPSPGS